MYTVFKYERTKVIITDHTDELGQWDHQMHGHQFWTISRWSDQFVVVRWIKKMLHQSFFCICPITACKIYIYSRSIHIPHFKKIPIFGCGICCVVLFKPETQLQNTENLLSGEQLYETEICYNKIHVTLRGNHSVNDAKHDQAISYFLNEIALNLMQIIKIFMVIYFIMIRQDKLLQNIKYFNILPSK